MDFVEIFIYFMVALPVILIGAASYYWVRTRSKPAVLYWNGEYLKHMNIDPDNTGAFKIKDEVHTLSGVTPILFKARILGVKQFTYFVHHSKLAAMSLIDFLDGNKEKFLSDIPPDGMKILLEGADIKATHQSLEAMRFNWKNPMLLAGIGIGLALGVLGVLIFYHPTIPIQIVDVGKVAAQSAGVAKVTGFLMM